MKSLPDRLSDSRNDRDRPQVAQGQGLCQKKPPMSVTEGKDFTNLTSQKSSQEDAISSVIPSLYMVQIFSMKQARSIYRRSCKKMSRSRQTSHPN